MRTWLLGAVLVLSLLPLAPSTAAAQSCSDNLYGDPTRCNDGNGVGGDGCSEACVVESDWTCPTFGQPCLANVTCALNLCSPYATCESAGGVDACVCRPGYAAGPVVFGATTCDDPNGLAVTPSIDAGTLAAELAGPGVQVATGTEAYSGADSASGTFAKGPPGLPKGVLVTSGDARLAAGPNESSGMTGENGGVVVEPLCTAILPGGMFFDAARLTFEFDLDEGYDGISFRYLFGSEEFPEYVGGTVNDVGGVFLDGVNVGLDADGNPITINGPFFSGAQVITATGTEYDGATPVLTYCKPLAAGRHTIEIVVCDTGDAKFDSGLFVSPLAAYSGACDAGVHWCGDGTTDAGEACDDGNTKAGDGCSPTCTIEISGCGDGSLDAGEACDDGNLVPFDGCDGNCAVEAGWTCTDTPGTKSACSKIPAGPVCGNGVLEAGEGCDDGDLDAGDGCDALCQVECGYSCQGVPGSTSTCAATCGDGKRAPGEACDDGDLENGDGCDGTCQVEAGFHCTGDCGATSACVADCPTCAQCGGACGPTCPDGYLCSVDAVCESATQLTVVASDDGDVLGGALIVPASGITASSQVFSGFSCSSGTFENGPLGSGDGVVLTTGFVKDALPPNDSIMTSTAHDGQYLSIEPRCVALAGTDQIFDAAKLVLAFSLAEDYDGIRFGYVFGSEEYPEYVGQYNDVAGVFLDGVNVAKDADGNDITINGPFFSGTQVVTANGTEYDGATPFLTYCAPLTPGEHTLEIVICDTSDAGYDSALFVSGLAGFKGACSPVAHWCGDGSLDAGEACDDGNSQAGDGCSTACTLEPGWSCPNVGVPCTRLTECETVGDCDDDDACTADACDGGYCVHAALQDSDLDGLCDALDACPNDPAKVDLGVCGCGEADSDGDGDGTADCLDGCPDDAAKVAAGACGCGVPDTDTDDDGTADCLDGCPDDAAKIAGGACGCGTADTDGDGDGTADCLDGCPDDAAKIAAGACGCGTPDTDSDEDGTADCLDGCPDDADKTEEGACGCGTPDTDGDGDGTADCLDGCPDDAAKVEPATCGCGHSDTAVDECAAGTADCSADASCTDTPCGYTCECKAGFTGNGKTCTPVTTCDDGDGDGICDDVDNCPDVANADQADLDGNDTGDACEAGLKFEFTGSGLGCNAAHGADPDLGGLLSLLGLALAVWATRRRAPYSFRGALPALLAGVTLAGGAATARAEAIDVQAFRPSPFVQDTFSVETGETDGPCCWSAGLFLNYQKSPLVLRAVRGGSAPVIREIVSDQLTANLLGSYRFAEWFALGLDVPVVAYQAGDSVPGVAAPKSFGLGDIRLYPRFRLLSVDHGLFTLGFSPTISVPTGGLIDPYMGNDNVVLLPTLMAALNLGRGGLALDVGAAAGIGKAKFANLDVSHLLTLKAGAWFAIVPQKLDLIAEAYSSTPLNQPFGDVNEAPLEVLGGLTWHVAPGFDLNAGGSGGVIRGVAAPEFRVVAGAQFFCAPPPPAPPVCDADPDGDGVCSPCVAEQHREAEFSAVCQRTDRCPDVPEDKDGFEDDDGCPDPDNDRDGLCDPWVTEKGQSDTFKTACRLSDQCPDVPEDEDGFEDDDGCPDPDNDKDGICDPWVEEQHREAEFKALCVPTDKCPDQPETRNSYQDDDGCPDKAVEITKKKVVILQTVLFYFDETRIKEESFPLLDEVVQTLKDNPQLRKIRIEAHTDERGKASHNLPLSKGRAKSVYDYMVAHGIDAKRLTSDGYAATRPLVKGARTEEDHQKNRRVEFTILQQD